MQYAGEDIPDFIASIIKTPQFKRLDDIHQYGLVYLFEKCAHRTRYDHSIMVYIFAKKMIDALEKNTPGLKIPTFYKNAVLVAALLHDIGHGPFSHTWERICDKKFHHEKNSKACINDIFENGSVEVNWMEVKPFDKLYATNLIKAFITGDPECLKPEDKEFLFLFDIVNNEFCGLDVDKWEYLTNDIKHMPGRIQVNVKKFEDIFLNARANSERTHIEYRYSDFETICSLYETRYNFHIHFYQKPLWICLEKIFKHIICESEEIQEQTEGMKFRDIRSNDNKFLHFTDTSVINYVKDPTKTMQFFVNCFEDPNKAVIEIHPETEDEKRLIPDYLKVETKIPKPGDAISKRIPFYGDESEKKEMHLETGFYKSVSYFKIKN